MTGDQRDQRFPLQESELLSIGALKDYAFRRLGSSGVDVELEEEDVKNAVADALAFYSTHKPLHATESWEAPDGISEHKWVKKHVRSMYDLQMTNLSISGASPAIESQLLSGSFAYAGAAFPRMDLRFYELQRQWIRIAQRELGSEPNYHMGDDKSSIWIYSPGQTTRCSATLSFDVAAPEDVRRGDIKWFRDYVTTLLKEPLGRARSKFSDIPSAGSKTTLDGATLLQEYSADKDKLEDKLINTRTDLIPSWG